MMKATSFISFLLAITLATAAQDNAWHYSKGGMPYQIFRSSTGQALIMDQYFKIRITQRLNDSVLFNSGTNPLPVYQLYTNMSQSYDMSELFSLELREGDSIVAFQLMDTFITRMPELGKLYNKNDTIWTAFTIEKVFHSFQSYEADQKAAKEKLLAREIDFIQNYLHQNNIQATKKGNGVFVRIVKPGTGKINAQAGDSISVGYKGTTFSGKQFDTNIAPDGKIKKPLQFPLGSGGMIEGFDSGLTGLKKGDQAVLYIPSTLAYGAQSPMPDIKAFENLIFEITVLDVKALVKKQAAISPKTTVKKPVQKPKPAPVKKN
jgi:FKBP-type peptidyl-prolyl cis-trans isomerase FkpA